MDETADCHKEWNSPDEAFDDSSAVYAFSDGTEGLKLGINVTDVKLESAYLCRVRLEYFLGEGDQRSNHANVQLLLRFWDSTSIVWAHQNWSP